MKKQRDYLRIPKNNQRLEVYLIIYYLQNRRVYLIILINKKQVHQEIYLITPMNKLQKQGVYLIILINNQQDYLEVFLIILMIKQQNQEIFSQKKMLKQDKLTLYLVNLLYLVKVICFKIQILKKICLIIIQRIMEDFLEIFLTTRIIKIIKIIKMLIKKRLIKQNKIQKWINQNQQVIINMMKFMRNYLNLKLKS